LPIIFTFLAFIGITVASATQQVYGGKAIWDPSVVVSKWDNRAARFFVAFSWAIASLGVNISANSVFAANDLTALFPRYVNIRRGQIICGILGGCVLVPWKILSSALSFLNFMAAYAIFLGPIAAVMIVDFW
jgi:nucleobase:cation symporter-1, NCS1 family